MRVGVSSRNAPCPCGSGVKYKRCCLDREYREGAAARFDDTVGQRIASWVGAQFADELETELERFAGGVEDDRDAQIFLTWFCSDRQLPSGGTPAERYAQRASLDERERAVARRIAGARLSLQRVLAAEEGRWIDLEDVLSGAVVRVRSGKVSREATRWDLLLCRVMEDDAIASLWGPAVFHGPSEEGELICELERLAAAHGLPVDSDDGAGIFRAAALELMRFTPASRSAEPAFFTVEGEPVAEAHAVWVVADVAAVLDRLDVPPELVRVAAEAGGVGEVCEWTVERAQAIARRRSLPKGAVCLERSLTALPGRVCVGTFVVTDEELSFTAMSETRLNGAIELVEERLGDLATLRDRVVAPVERSLPPQRDAEPARRELPRGLTAARARDMERQMVTDHFTRWVDEPLETLGGRTPRQAAKDDRSDELERLLREIENRADRARRTGVAWPECELDSRRARDADRPARGVENRGSEDTG